MKRIGNIYEQICSMENLRLAEKKARKGKLNQPGVKKFDKAGETNLFMLHEMLLNKTYNTSTYTVFKVYEPKEREVYRLPYFPDRITHHAIMNVLEPVFVSTFTADTYSCIKGRGISGASYALRNAIKNTVEAKYYLQLDIKKFYPNVDHQILKDLLRRKIKDNDLLWLLDEIIHSAPGLPIGNYLSQYFANFYLTYLDHYIKQELKAFKYFRYCDDLILFASNKPDLHRMLHVIREYLKQHLKLEVKGNYRIAPTTCGVNCFGFIHYPECVYIRKKIKQRFARAIAKGHPRNRIAAYYGWAKHANAKNLLKKLNMTSFSELKIKTPVPAMEGNKIEMFKVLNKEIKVWGYEIKPSKYPDKGNGKCLYMQIEIDGLKRVLFTGSGVLMETLELVPKDAFPFTTTIVKENERFQFT